MASRYLISSHHLACRYGNFWALKDINFAISAGEKVALLGPNGAGKSTLIRCLVGLQEPHMGHSSINGQHPQSLKARRQTAFLPESNPLPLIFKVNEYLMDRCRQYGQKKSKIDEVLEAVQLEDKKRQLIHTLSHGMRQRLALAATLVTGADILILDEPTSGLDPTQVLHVRKLLSSLKDKTIILSTHLIGDAEAVCDRALLLNTGSLCYDGPANNLDKKFREVVG